MDSPAHRCVQATTDRGYFSARALQRALRHLPVVMLHDRRLPGGALIEHLAVGPGGVTVVGGWSTAEPAAVRARVTAVQELIGDLAVVKGALCVDGEGTATRLHPLEVEGIVVARTKDIAQLAARDGDLRDYELAALVDYLDAALPPAL